MTVAFDIDNTLFITRSDGAVVPDLDLIAVLRWFLHNGDTVVVWSGGGVEYAERMITKVGLDRVVTVIPKAHGYSIDLTFDDVRETNLGKYNVLVRRESNVVQ